MIPEVTANDPFALDGVTLGGKYRVDKLVGSGGFGVVYHGTHLAFDEPIAIKCLRVADDLAEDERTSLMEKLRDEGAVLHRLSKRTSAIVQALDVDATTTPSGHWVPYLVLAWLEGQTLAAHLAERQHNDGPHYTVRAATALLAPVFRGLAHAHRHKVAHRDVKPDNLFLEALDGPPSLKVLDFGIAKVLSGHASFTASPAATRERPTAFTPLYGAPEQFNKRLGASGPWTDVFALALVMVEMVTGRRALDGDNPTQLYVAATNPDARPTLRYHGSDPGDAVEAVLERALAVDPQERFTNAGQFWEELQRALNASSPGSPVAIADTGAFLEEHALLGDLGERSDPGYLAADSSTGVVDSAADTVPVAVADADTATAASATTNVLTPTPSSVSSRLISDEPIAHFEVQVIDLARKGVPLTVANVVAETGLTRENAAAWLEQLSDRSELQRSHHDSLGALYQVPGLTLSAAPQGIFGKARTKFYRLLHIRRDIPPRIPAPLRKSIPFGACFAAFVPFVGLLYAAPIWSALLITIGAAVLVGLLQSLPVVGSTFGYLTPIIWTLVNGVFGATYTWHYNRHGKRTPLRAVNYDLPATQHRASQHPSSTPSSPSKHS